MRIERLRLSKLTAKQLPVIAGVIALLGVLTAIALGGYVVLSHRQALTLASPTGPYAVGRSEYDWIVPTRIDPFAPDRNAKREVVVWVWYPAPPATRRAATAPYLPAAWVQTRAQDQGISAWIEHDLSAIRTHSVADAPLAEAQRAYPVLIMQPGMGPIVTDYTVLAENLASHGYVVFGIDPTYTAKVVVFPDGRVALRAEGATIPDRADAVEADEDANRIQKVWTADARFVLDELERLDADPASRFYQRLDLAHVGLFGHSFGGATALRVCELDARCRAGADLDGTLFSDEAAGSLQRPFLFMTEDGCGSNCDTMRQMVAKAVAAATCLSVRGAKHFNFSDLPLRLLPPARLMLRAMGAIGSIRPQRGLEITDAYLVAFFDETLKGVDSGLLQGPSAAYPGVQFGPR
jgi:dienelactone hydrolase